MYELSRKRQFLLLPLKLAFPLLFNGQKNSHQHLSHCLSFHQPPLTPQRACTYLSTVLLYSVSLSLSFTHSHPLSLLHSALLLPSTTPTVPTSIPTFHSLTFSPRCPKSELALTLHAPVASPSQAGLTVWGEPRSSSSPFPLSPLTDHTGLVLRPILANLIRQANTPGKAL